MLLNGFVFTHLQAPCNNSVAPGAPQTQGWEPPALQQFIQTIDLQLNFPCCVGWTAFDLTAKSTSNKK